MITGESIIMPIDISTLDQKDDRGVMVGWRYADGRNYLPGDSVVKKLRPAEAMK